MAIDEQRVYEFDRWDWWWFYRHLWNSRRPYSVGAYPFYRLGMHPKWPYPPTPPFGPPIDGGVPLYTGPGIVDGGTSSTLFAPVIDGGRPWTSEYQYQTGEPDHHYDELHQ